MCAAQLVVSVDDSSIRVWDTRTCEQLYALRQHKGQAFVLECHPTDSRIGMWGAYDGNIYLFDLATGERLSRYSGHVICDVNSTHALSCPLAQSIVLRVGMCAAAGHLRAFPPSRERNLSCPKTLQTNCPELCPSPVCSFSTQHTCPGGRRWVDTIPLLDGHFTPDGSGFAVTDVSGQVSTVSYAVLISRVWWRLRPGPGAL